MGLWWGQVCRGGGTAGREKLAARVENSQGFSQLHTSALSLRGETGTEAAAPQ